MTQAPQIQGTPFIPQQQVNAVKIDIINPQAYGPGTQAPSQPQNGYYYNYPQAPAYGMPTCSCYNCGQPPTIPQPQYAPVNIQPSQVSIPAAVVDQPPTPAPTVPLTTEQPIPQAPPVEPVAMEQPPAAPPEPPEAPPVPVDYTAINNALASNDINAQTAAIQEIAVIGQNDPVKAKGLLNEQTFQSLVDIINKDTKGLPGPQRNQKELSNLEKAELNKQFGSYTLAILQKSFRDQVDKETSKQGQPSISINELPGVKSIVDNLKDNPNPAIRAASISSLTYVAKPEDKEVLKTIFEISAKQDADPEVKKAAQDALAKLG
ncbi:MAG: hypothetical protein WC197_04930 [Candidatus Gastranaerophilaceae bacterium]|jgi:hypothetical protein